jgi:hypothetical protein
MSIWLRELRLSTAESIWLPPEGYCFASLFATTYSLEEAVIAEIALRFLNRRSRSATRLGSLAPGEVKSLLLMTLAGSCRILYDRSALTRSRDRTKSLYPLFAPFLREVPLHKGRGGAIRFHPKLLWALFRNEATGRVDKARIVIGSQNLAIGGDCLEAAVALNLERPVKRLRAAERQALATLVDDLADICRGWGQQKFIAPLVAATRAMRPVDWPAAIETLAVFNSKTEPLVPQLLGAKTPVDLLAVTPFVHKSMLTELERKTPPGSRVAIVTRNSSLNALTTVDPAANPYPKLRFGSLRHVTTTRDRDLHAKLYAIDDGRGAAIIVGSSNLTQGGGKRNHELNCTFPVMRNRKAFDAIWRRLLPLNAPSLADAPGEEVDPETALRDHLVEWISQWKLTWDKAPGDKLLEHLPLTIVTTDMPAEVAETLPKAAMVVVRSGQLATRAVPPPRKTAQLAVELVDHTDLTELSPLIEIEVGPCCHWVLPDYAKFPNRKHHETYSAEDLMSALYLLVRPSHYKRFKRNTDKSARERGRDPHAVASVDLEKIVVSAFSEHPDGISDTARKKAAQSWRSFVSRVSPHSRTDDHDALLDALLAAALVLERSSA